MTKEAKRIKHEWRKQMRPVPLKHFAKLIANAQAEPGELDPALPVAAKAWFKNKKPRKR